jgi:uncharacterized protein YndB with AHSA1/START domain
MSISATQYGHVEGTLRSNGDGKGTVRMESLYATDAGDLWLALTQPNRLARWIADVKGDLRVGGSLSARFTSGWEGIGRVESCDPQRRLTVTMSPETADETLIDAVLAIEQSGTRLIVEEQGIPLAEIGKHGAGWHTHIEDLARHLGEHDQLDWRSRWVELTPTYERRAEALG